MQRYILCERLLSNKSVHCKKIFSYLVFLSHFLVYISNYSCIKMHLLGKSNELRYYVFLSEEIVKILKTSKNICQ